MQELFVKKYWKDEDVLFYIHFQNGIAIRQIEFNSNGKVFLNVENPRKGESMLYDQSLDDLEIDNSDFITKEEFDKMWNDK